MKNKFWESSAHTKAKNPLINAIQLILIVVEWLRAKKKRSHLENDEGEEKP